MPHFCLLCSLPNQILSQTIRKFQFSSCSGDYRHTSQEQLLLLGYCEIVASNSQTVAGSPQSGVDLPIPLPDRGLRHTLASIAANNCATRGFVAQIGLSTDFPYRLEALDAELVFPLKPFLKTRITLPNDPKAMLVQSYGEGWKIPDPLFHFNWPDAKRRFHPLCNFDYAL